MRRGMRSADDRHNGRAVQPLALHGILQLSVCCASQTHHDES